MVYLFGLFVFFPKHELTLKRYGIPSSLQHKLGLGLELGGFKIGELL